jgi:hypothetical protein
MKVRATKAGFYKSYMKPGAVFEFEGKKLGSWMELVDEAEPVTRKKPGPKPKAEKEPETFSELQKLEETKAGE